MVLIKKIGITSRIMETTDYHEERDALSQDWTVFLQSMNLIPVFIPNTLFDIDNFLKTLDLDGVILSGGDNIGDHPKRDKTENHIIKYAISNKLPLLGVCRGMQVINNFFTGEILKSDNNKHVNTSHNVTLSNSPFSKIILHEKITVNSYHQNLIKSKTLGDNLTSFAIDNSDSTIEGFFHQLLPIIGIMWHPERNPTKNSKIILENTFNNNSFWTE